jgi:hypothetical protein
MASPPLPLPSQNLHGGEGRARSTLHARVIRDRPISAYLALNATPQRQIKRAPLVKRASLPPLACRSSREPVSRFGGAARVTARGARRCRLAPGPRLRKNVVTFGRYQPAANQVDLVAHENDRPRGYVIAPPQGLQDLLGDAHRRPVGRRVDDAVRVRLVRRDAIFRLRTTMRAQAC